MDDLIIHSTASTPEIKFENSGRLSIKGKSLPEDPKIFFNPLFKWVKGLSMEKLEIDVKLDYVSTSSSKRIIELIKAIDINNGVKKINIKWFYEVDDPDMLEFGEIIERSLKKTKINYVEYQDLDD